MRDAFKTISYCLISVFLALPVQAAATIIAIQDFETVPSGPVWTYTGVPNAFVSGDSLSSAAPANSPLGIGGSRAWNTTAVSGGNPVVFDNQLLPMGFTGFSATFSLAAMDLIGSSGGPDDLDFVLVSYSLDAGATWVDRLRVRGAINNNSFWGYDATGDAIVDYLPTTEAVFQPTNSGLQSEFGYSTVAINFPGTINQLSLRITPRSSSSTDSWLIDNVTLVAIPEPSTHLLLGLGALAAVFQRRKI
jgi:hypothetical protein